MKRLLVFLLMFPPALVAFSQQVPPEARGSRLFAQCKADVRYLDNPDAASHADMMPAQACTAYIDGFLDGLAMGGSKAICYGSVSLGTLARVYVLYMQKNPKQLDVEKSVGLTGALLESYECKVAR